MTSPSRDNCSVDRFHLRSILTVTGQSPAYAYAKQSAKPSILKQAHAAPPARVKTMTSEKTHHRKRATPTPRYRATITSGSLKISESRLIAELLLRGVTASEWQTAILDDNILQARSPETAKRLTNLLRARLELMQPELWRMVSTGSIPVATHACLAAAVKHSALLGDFLDLVVREHYQLYEPALTLALWERYVEDCRNRDPDMLPWSDSTTSRLRSTVYQILAQAGYIESTKTLKLQSVRIAPEVLQYLVDQDEQYVLRCLQIGR